MPIHIVNNIWPAFGNNMMQMFIDRLNEPPEHPKHANPNALLHTASHTHCDGVISAVFGQNRTYWAPTRVHVDRLPTPTYILSSVVCTLYHCHLPLLVAVCDYYMECTEAKVLSLSLTLFRLVVESTSPTSYRRFCCHTDISILFPSTIDCTIVLSWNSPSQKRKKKNWPTNRILKQWNTNTKLHTATLDLRIK